MDGSQYAELAKVLKSFLTESEAASILSRIPLTESTTRPTPITESLATDSDRRLLGIPVKAK